VLRVEAQAGEILQERLQLRVDVLWQQQQQDAVVAAAAATMSDALLAPTTAAPPIRCHSPYDVQVE
jgi:hypothetical protein